MVVGAVKECIGLQEVALHTTSSSSSGKEDLTVPKKVNHMEALRKKQYGPTYTNKGGKSSIQKQIRLELGDNISTAPADEDVLSFWKFKLRQIP